MASKALPEQLPELYPWSWKLSMAWSSVTALLLLGMGLVGGIGPRWPSESAVVEATSGHAFNAILLIFSAVFLEVGFLVTGVLSRDVASERAKGELANHRFTDAALTLCEYALKLIPGLYIWGIGQPIHTDTLAWGDHRPVYLARFVSWSTAVPVLVVITNRAFFAEFGNRATFLRSAPSMVLAFLYCWAAWVMEVTPSPFCRWANLVLSLSGAVVVSIDQVHLAYQCRHVKLFKMKASILIYQLVTFLMYALIFLAGRFGLLALQPEQAVYCYFDATVKVLEGAMLALLRCYEDSEVIKHWHATATCIQKDLNSMIMQEHVPIIGLDMDFKITSWNDCIAKLSAIASSDALGKSFSSFLMPDCQEDFAKACDRLRQSKKASGLFEVSLKLKTGEATLMMNLVPRSEQQGLCGAMAISQDLTEISQIKAVESKKAQLLAVMGHEFRSPLHGIIGLITSMVTNPKNSHVKKQLTMIRACSARLLDLTTNVMDMSEAEKRRQAGAPAARPTQKVNFREIASEVVMMTNLAVDKANRPLLKPDVKLVNELDQFQHLPLVCGDPYKCTQLLYNLLTNACKFTQNGSIRIRAERQQSTLQIHVIDSGPGIPKDSLGRIFRAFEQEHSSEAKSFQGIGLGLSVVQDIIDLHEGTIKVYSEVGQGSDFVVSLPCFESEYCPEPEPDTEEQDSKQAIPTSPPTKAHPVHDAPPPVPRADTGRNRPLILAVDDEEVNHQVLKDALSDKFEIISAMDGPEAISILTDLKKKEGMPPELVLLDVQMPGMTGYEVCKYIRKNFEASKIQLPITLLSAKCPTNNSAIEGLDAGASDYIPKPFDVELLRKKISVALEVQSETRGVQRRDHHLEKAMLITAESKLSQEAQRTQEALSKLKESERCLEEMEQQLQKRISIEESNKALEHELQKAKDRIRTMEQELEKSQAISCDEGLRQRRATKVCEKDGQTEQFRQLSEDLHKSKVIIDLQARLSAAETANQMVTDRLRLQDQASADMQALLMHGKLLGARESTVMGG